MKVAVVANTAWYIANFRLRLMHALKECGHKVVAISQEGADAARITSQGFEHFAFPLARAGVNPLRELLSVIALRKILRRERIELLLTYTPKGNLYAALAAFGLGCEHVANVSGLGVAFTRMTWVTFIAQCLYRITFRRSAWVFFQNQEDLDAFLRNSIVSPDKAERLPGSGVDLVRFSEAPLVIRRGHVVFLLVARLLNDKGIREFVAAARRLRAKLPDSRFQLLGPLEQDNSNGIPASDIREWQQEGIVEYLGYAEDVRPHIANATCIVLPSAYREGVPRSLLEGGARGRPLIASSMPGCRDAVEEGVNGFLCTPGDVASLERAMLAIASMEPPALEAMGRNSRVRMVQRFDERFVIDRYLDVVGRISEKWKCTAG